MTSGRLFVETDVSLITNKLHVQTEQINKDVVSVFVTGLSLCWIQTAAGLKNIGFLSYLFPFFTDLQARVTLSGSFGLFLRFHWINVISVCG